MKKILPIIAIVLVCATLFCACSGGGDDSGAANITLQRGVTSTTAYQNESLGITFTKPDDWTFYESSFLAASSGLTESAWKNENLFAKSDFVLAMEFMAVSPDGDNINMMVESLKARGNRNVTVEEYISLSKTQLLQQNSTYAFSTKTTSITLGDNTFSRITAQSTTSGVAVTQYFYVLKIDYFIVSFIATTPRGTLYPYDFENMFR